MLLSISSLTRLLVPLFSLCVCVLVCLFVSYHLFSVGWVRVLSLSLCFLSSFWLVILTSICPDTDEYSKDFRLEHFVRGPGIDIILLRIVWHIANSTNQSGMWFWLLSCASTKPLAWSLVHEPSTSRRSTTSRTLVHLASRSYNIVVESNPRRFLTLWGLKGSL